MKIKKDTLVRVRHSRKGVFVGVATEDFNTKDEWYPVRVSEDNGIVEGISNYWEEGEDIPCRGSLCQVEVLK